MTLLYVFLLVVALFGVWLAVKNLLGWRLCVICMAVSSAWAGLFIAYKMGWFEDQVLLALLMGQSVIGIYFFLEKRVQDKWLLFRLPALLTLTYVFYTALMWQLYVPATIGLLGVWLIFGLVYTTKTKSHIKRLVKRLIECCGAW